MSSPHLGNYTVTEYNSRSQPSMFDSQEELLENGNVHEKPDKHDASSTSIQVVDQCPFPIGTGNGDELDSILFLEQQTSAPPDHHNMNEVLQKEQLQFCPSGNSDLHFRPFNDSDFSFSFLQVSSTLMPMENNARTNELDSSSLILEPVEPNIEAGSLLKSRHDYPINNILCAALKDSDELALLKQGSGTPLPSEDEKTNNDDQTDLSLDVVPDQQEVSAEPCSGKGLSSKRVRANAKGRNYRIKGSQAGNKEVQADKGEGSTAKKQEHNAKERVRRMKLHASYLALGALMLPDSSRSKKRKSAQRIIERAVEYIPELEEEIEKLTVRKNDMLSKIKNKQPALNQNTEFQLHEVEDPSVSVNEFKQGEFVIQICKQRHADDAFSNILQKVEEEGLCILSASTLQVSDDVVCYHLHIQINGSLSGANNQVTSFLREKVISWVR